MNGVAIPPTSEVIVMLCPSTVTASVPSAASVTSRLSYVTCVQPEEKLKDCRIWITPAAVTV